jgi:predicted chitinase
MYNSRNCIARSSSSMSETHTACETRPSSLGRKPVPTPRDQLTLASCLLVVLAATSAVMGCAAEPEDAVSDTPNAGQSAAQNDADVESSPANEEQEVDEHSDAVDSDAVDSDAVDSDAVDSTLGNSAEETGQLAQAVSSNSAGYRIDRKTFYDNFRSAWGRLTQSQVDGINYLLNNIEQDTRPAVNNKTVWMRQIAYVFSTVKHEVANTYQPITEYGNENCPRYDGGCTYKGRGYVQLTHKYNYKKFSSIVGVDLVSYPSRALEPNIAYTVLSHGMHYGIFTGKKLGSYIRSGTTDYVNARRVVNGLDKASLLAGYATSFQVIMEKSTGARI